MQSGTGIAWWGSLDTREEQRENAFLLGEEVGCDSEDTTSLVQCLRQVDADELQQAYLSVSYSFLFVFVCICIIIIIFSILQTRN